MLPLARSCICGLYACLAALGVGTTGSIVGLITDPSGALVANAGIWVRNQDTGAQRILVSNARGEYVAALLTPGVYELTVERPGFRRSVWPDIRVNVDQTVRLDVSLQLGEVREDVRVTTPSPLIQTDTSEIGHVVDRRNISSLPLNERNFLTFTLLVPGTQLAADGSQNSTQGGSVSINGAREQSNNFLLDGVDNNDLAINQYSVLPGVEAIQEFKVQSSNPSAEFGRSGGAQINVVMRSGTNQFHGSVFEYLRNRHLDAKNFFDLPECAATSVVGTCGEIPRLDRNQFGGSFGGPLRRDRTFFFTSYESLRLRQATTRKATVPSQVERQLALNLVPAESRNAAGLAVFNLLPAANTGPDLHTSNEFIASPTTRDTVHQSFLKVDHKIGTLDTVSGHYAHFYDDRYNPYDLLGPETNLPGYGTTVSSRGHNGRVTWLHVFDGRLVNELRLGFNRLRAGLTQENKGTNRTREIGFPQLSADPADFGYPVVLIPGYDGIGEPHHAPQRRSDTTFHYSNNVAWSPVAHGERHQFRFGGEVRRVRANAFLDNFARGQWIFGETDHGHGLDSLVALLRGIPDLAIAPSGRPGSALRTTATNFYLQDDFRVAQRFTLNLGVRYELNSPPVDVHDRRSIPDFSARSATCRPRPDCQYIRAGTNGVPRGLYNRDINNVAPRIGFAWRPLANLRWVARGAYGIFYDAGILNITLLPSFNPPFYYLRQYHNFNRATIQTLLDQPGEAEPETLTLSSDVRDAYMQHWNLALQFEVKPELAVEAAYVASKGTSLPSQRNPNQARLGSPDPPYPQFGTLLQVGPFASSVYHSLQLKAQRRRAGGLTFTGSYTWSKSIDNASAWSGNAAEPATPQDSHNLQAQRGLSAFHTVHRLVASYVYDLPFGRGRRWLTTGKPAAIVGNWQLGGLWTFQTGHPLTVNRSVNQSGTGHGHHGTADRPDQIADPFGIGAIPDHPDPDCRRTTSQGGRAAETVRDPAVWFNPCAFAAPDAKRFGTAGRNTVIGPGTKSVDISLVKTLLIGEFRHLQLRAEVFNLANHPNFDTPNRIFDSRSFAAVQSANRYGHKPPRQIQIGLRFLF